LAHPWPAFEWRPRCSLRLPRFLPDNTCNRADNDGRPYNVQNVQFKCRRESTPVKINSVALDVLIFIDVMHEHRGTPPCTAAFDELMPVLDANKARAEMIGLTPSAFSYRG
jgi:hypothetical protein